MPNPLIYLASASPRRSALLAQIGVAHRISPMAVDESLRDGESPRDYVSRLAVAKAQALWQQLQAEPAAIVIGSDTTVTLGAEIFGKPADRDDCVRILGKLSGQTHQVCTAVAVCGKAGVKLALSVSDVTFRPLTPQEINVYWRSGEPRDKAGAYAIQGFAAAFITRISGSYSGIMGLPLFETSELLHAHGWRSQAEPDATDTATNPMSAIASGAAR